MDITNKVSSFAERLDFALKQTNRKQADLAREANLSRATVSRYIEGSVLPTHRTLLRIAEILQVSEQWLTGFDVPSGIPAQSISEQAVGKLDYALLCRNECNLHFIDNTLMKEICKVSSFPERLAFALKGSSKGVSELAHEVNLSRQSINNYLSGNVSPTTDSFINIAQALDVSELWLSGFDVPMKRSSEGDNANIDDDALHLSKAAQKQAQEALTLVSQVLRNPALLRTVGLYLKLPQEEQSKADTFISYLADKNEKTP